MVAPPCRMKPGLQLYWMVVPTKSLGSDRDLVECSTWPGSEQYMTEKKEYIRKTDLKVAQKHTCNPTPTPKPSWWLGLKDCDVNEVEQFENETQNKWPKWRRRSLYFLSKFHKYLWFLFYFWCTSENFGLMVALKNELATRHIDQPLRTMNILYKHWQMHTQ